MTPNLDRRVRFYSPSDEAPDEFGTTESSWVEEFTVWANVRYLRGGETVLADRLESRNPAIITVRRSSGTAQINDSWLAEVVGPYESARFNIRENPRRTEDRRFFEFLGQSGVAL